MIGLKKAESVLNMKHGVSRKIEGPKLSSDSRICSKLLAYAALCLLLPSMLASADGNPGWIAADCSQDTTAAFNTWIASLPDNSTIELASNACYRLDETLNIDGKTGLTIYGNGATFKRLTPTPDSLVYPHSNMHMHISNSTNIVLKDLHITGMNNASDLDPQSPRVKSYVFEPEKFGSSSGNKPFESGIEFSNDDGVTMQNLSIDGTYGDGITIGGEAASLLVKNLTATNIRIDRNGRQAVSLVAAENVVLDKIQALHSHAVGFDLEPNGATASVSGVKIRNSYVNTYTVAFSLAGGAGKVSNIDIHNNTVRSTDPAFPWLSGENAAPDPLRQNWRILNNLVQIPSLGIVVSNILNVAVEKNVSPITKGYSAVTLNNVTGTIVIAHNDFSGAGNVNKNISVDGSLRICGNRLQPDGGFDQPERCSSLTRF